MEAYEAIVNRLHLLSDEQLIKLMEYIEFLNWKESVSNGHTKAF